MKDNQIEMISFGFSHTILLKRNNDVFVCGSNSHGQIGFGKEVNKVSKFTILLKEIEIQKIQCSEYSSLILKRNSNEFITFGQNNKGQVLLFFYLYFRNYISLY